MAEIRAYSPTRGVTGASVAIDPQQGPRGDAFLNFYQIINVRSVLKRAFPDDSEYVFNFSIGHVLLEL